MDQRFVHDQDFGIGASVRPTASRCICSPLRERYLVEAAAAFREDRSASSARFHCLNGARSQMFAAPTRAIARDPAVPDDAAAPANFSCMGFSTNKRIQQ
jgi:hypothetical protein